MKNKKKNREDSVEDTNLCPVCGYSGNDVICPACGGKMESLGKEIEQIAKAEEEKKELFKQDEVSLEIEQEKERDKDNKKNEDL